MRTKHSLKREEFQRLLSQCLEILAQHGVVQPQPVAFFENAFDQYEVERRARFERDSIKVEPRNPRWLDWDLKKLDEVTLECALVFEQHWPEQPLDLETNLNYLRNILARYLNDLGYCGLAINQDSHYRTWGCYTAWEEMARRLHLNEEYIDSVRCTTRILFPEIYEE